MTTRVEIQGSYTFLMVYHIISYQKTPYAYVCVRVGGTIRYTIISHIPWTMRMNKNSEYCRNWRARNPEKAKQINHNSYLRRTPTQKTHDARRNKKRQTHLKKTMIRLLGGKCACCGLTEWWCLEADHIIPEKIKHMSLGKHYTKVIENLDKYQLLCSGCNRAKGNRPSCRLDHSERSLC